MTSGGTSARTWPFESYSIDATISDDVSPTVNLYVAPIGIAALSGTKFYGGIQTQADGYTKRDQNLRKIGPGFLMSMWGQRSPDAIRPSPGGFWQSSGHEGDFVSVRRPCEWKKGKYTYRVVRMDREVVDGKSCTWVGAFVYSHENDENIFVGALRFPGENLVLGRKVASFVEIYGRQIPVEEIPKVTVIHFHGTGDEYLPFKGGTGTRSLTQTKFYSVEHSITAWVKADGCPETPVVTVEPKKADDGTTVPCKTYGPGKAGAEVVLFVIMGGGHTWPRRDPRVRFLGKSTQNLSANDLMWEFFQRHSMK